MSKIVEADLSEFGKKSEVYDESHLKQHLEGEIEGITLSEDKERFHYFSMNDLNKDNFIDGIEVWKAIHHHHDERRGKIETDEEIEKVIDETMKEIDLNGDGMIDYSEFVKKLEVE